MTIKHLGQAELAERWNISPRTLERWRWLGQGPRHLKIGGRCVYTVQEIEAFEAARVRESTSTILGAWFAKPPSGTLTEERSDPAEARTEE